MAVQGPKGMPTNLETPPTCAVGGEMPSQPSSTAVAPSTGEENEYGERCTANADSPGFAIEDSEATDEAIIQDEEEKNVVTCTPGPSPEQTGEDEREINLKFAKYHRGWRRVVRNFTPSWFSVNMGTGIVSILLHNLPYNGSWLYWISVAMFALNVLLFCCFFCISLLRYTLYPEIWMSMISHPAQSLFVGTFPMGLATIVNMTVFVCVPAWGSKAINLAWALWWIDVVIAVFSCFYLPFLLMSVHKIQLETMTAAWLLPIVATIVAAASGGIVADVLPNPQHALWTIVVSYILWGTGVPLAMAVLVIYFQRLTLFKLPPREVIVSVFLPLGPLGQGGFAVMQLGKVALKTFAKTRTLEAAGGHSGEILYVVGWLMAIIMWGFGVLWLFFALATIRKSKFPFNIGWWGFTFPLGVFTVSTTTIAKELPSTFFKVLGTIFSVAVTFLWIMVVGGTLWKLRKGQILYAPCLASLEAKETHAKEHLGEKSV